MTVAAVLLLAVLSAYFYRKGGTSAGTWWRDALVPACAIAIWFITGGRVHTILQIFLVVATYGLMYASLTTYFKKKDTDAMWWNWLLVGMAFGIAALPLVFVSLHWLGFILRTVILMVGVTLWSEKISIDTWEERGRGFLFAVTMPLLNL